MPVNQKSLLADCQRQLKLLEADLKAQTSVLSALEASLRAEYDAAREAKRVGDAFEIWRGEQATQAAVHWMLGTVFVRFLEDNGLIDPALAGEGDRGRIAEAAEQAFYMANPTLHERDWLLHVFRKVGALAGGAALFDERHNPVFRWDLSPDAAKVLLRYWRRVDPATGTLVHNLADRDWSTRFLGDLYQDLSEGARKKYALLQTPDFVEEFILDRTLGEALKVLPLPAVTMIDPTCGSGHFMLSSFSRLLTAWESKEPSATREVLAQRALDQVAGVDLNPFAVAIARFRLLIAALKKCEVARLERAPGFRLNVAVGDSLLHGAEPGQLALGDGGRGRYVRHTFADEDLELVDAILTRQYAVVVGNPPYITVKDRVLNVAYRERYRTCFQQYALGVPFIERFWQLATPTSQGGNAGWIGIINSNSFMKRDFGRRLVEDFFPTVDLTDVIDTSGAYIPGHGTPTVLLFGRNRPPITDHVKAILGVRGEPCAPLDPAKGLVWTAIKDCIDNVDAGGGFVTATDTSRTVFAKHPWSIGGGGAADLRVLLDSHAATSLGEHADIGYLVVTGEDGCLLLSKSTFQRHGISQITPLADGEALRDWQWRSEDAVLWPYETDGSALRPELLGKLLTFLWPYRETLRQRKAFGVPVEQKGLSWWDLREVYRHRLVDPRAIPFAFVATHNHFVFSRGGSVFKQSSPVINLSATATEADYLGLLGLLNSSTSAFWLRQVCHNKGGGGIGGGLATETWEQFMEYTSTALEGFPVTPELPAELAGELDQLAQTWQSFLPAPLIKRDGRTRDHLDRARSAADEAFSRMVSLQEELDWQCYRLYGLTEDELTLSGTGGDSLISPPLRLGERAFEIVLSRRVAAGSEETAWFARHGSTPITEIPSHWPAEYRALVERRIALIEQDRNIALIERPEHKRRWNVETWQELERAALDEWLLERLESHTYWPNVALQTTRDLAERASLDSEFGQVAAIRFGEGVALEPAIRELVSNEAVPFLPALRYTASGREKRRVWEQVWTLQRREDVVDAFVAADASFATRREGESQDAFAKRLAGVQKARREVEVGAIPRPPKYAPADFQRAEFWRMRGALDVPKERFIAYQYSGRDGDDAPLLGWAGWNQLQQAEALAGWYADRTSEDGWTGDRVVPLLAGMAELVPWLKQRHNEYDPRFGDRPGEAYSLWLDDALQAHGLTRAALDAWEPPRAARRARKAASRTSA